MCSREAEGTPKKDDRQRPVDQKAGAWAAGQQQADFYAQQQNQWSQWQMQQDQ
jgi:hypothetical protein